MHACDAKSYRAACLPIQARQLGVGELGGGEERQRETEKGAGVKQEVWGRAGGLKVPALVLVL